MWGRYFCNADITKRLTCALLFLSLAACSNPVILGRIDGRPPAGTDLSGQWKARDDATADSLRGAWRDELVGVFLEMGSRLKVTQTEHGLFVSFDRSVVEEYRFGENREINVGPVTAQRVSGWVGERYRIETLASDGAILREEYWLSRKDGLLVREITIKRNDKTRFEKTVRFARLTG